MLTEYCYHREMIHTFSVSNFRSIREKVALDLRIPETAPDLPRFRRSTARPAVRLPSIAVLVGPNGSGKTALLDALLATIRVASSLPSPVEHAIPHAELNPFASDQTVREPTEFFLELEADWLTPGVDRHLFRYELGMKRDSEERNREQICHEALSYFPKGRPRRLFRRTGPDGPTLGSRDLGVRLKDVRLEAVRSNASVIATLAHLNVPIAKRIAEYMRTLTMASNRVPFGKYQMPTQLVTELIGFDDDLHSWSKRQIQCSDLGIRDFEVVDGREGAQVFFRHHGLDQQLPLEAESSGTKRLFHILPQLRLALRDGIPSIFDEIDGDLHVDIASEILRWFLAKETNPKDAQLLVSTHNVGLLEDLEKEEVFVCEKDLSGATQAHGAQDVRGLRRDTRLYPKYRAGVLGGVPRVG